MFNEAIKYEVGIVGATGAVGVEIVQCLAKRSFPLSNLHLYASAKSVGKRISTAYGDVEVEEYQLHQARKCQLIFLAVSGEFALLNAKELAADDGPIVIENSSAFRYDSDIPLVVSLSVILKAH